MREQSIIRNPLTVIAVFAGIAEVSGTVVLPLLKAEQQDVFMWFVMGFPCLLVALFFATLIFRHEVLYAPSDFRNDDAFLRARDREKRAALRAKFQEDMAFATDTGDSEDEQESPNIPTGEPAASQEYPHNSDPPGSFPVPTRVTAGARTARASYALAEKLILEKLEHEISGKFDRNTVLIDGDAIYAFDATVQKDGWMIGIDVKYFPQANFSRGLLRSQLTKLDSFFKGMSPDTQLEFKMILAIATDAGPERHAQIRDSVRSVASGVSVPLDIRLYDMQELEAELSER